MSVSPRRHKLTGICPPARGAIVAGLMRAQPARLWLVLARDGKLADALAEDIAFFHHNAEPKGDALAAFVFPENMPEGGDMREAFAASSDRLAVLSRLRSLRTPAAGR